MAGSGRPVQGRHPEFEAGLARHRRGVRAALSRSHGQARDVNETTSKVRAISSNATVIVSSLPEFMRPPRAIVNATRQAAAAGTGDLAPRLYANKAENTITKMPPAKLNDLQLHMFTPNSVIQVAPSLIPTDRKSTR